MKAAITCRAVSPWMRSISVKMSAASLPLPFVTPPLLIPASIGAKNAPEESEFATVTLGIEQPSC